MHLCVLTDFRLCHEVFFSVETKEKIKNGSKLLFTGVRRYVLVLTSYFFF